MPKKKAWAFNDTQIKHGWIVKLRKDGTIKAKIEPWYPKVKNIKTITEKE
jgi:hypothetical protein